MTHCIVVGCKEKHIEVGGSCSRFFPLNTDATDLQQLVFDVGSTVVSANPELADGVVCCSK